MSYQIKQPQKEIDEVRNQCVEQELEGRSKFPGMTYEQGVQAALDWIIGDSDSNPMAD